ncbi:response regulator transcription factor [Rufibacter sediminis]|uniref:Response regulator transcription factor n=1 Tax=Rufibacter sediminis TaxID=2762756 RepID=A0ABR6VT40_9BACT|nr:response regulator transcription factor [Rufibacter sediminis]MBC3540329.1 response regulator transcription factor [Rufibacter sediminis]
MKPPRLLLLEDEVPLAKILQESLQKRGFAVTHAPNGKEGLELFRQQSFAICVVDVMMPHLDGFSFVRELRKVNNQLPVLFLTAKSQTQDLVQGYASGGNDYLKKPFTLEELVLRLQELLRRQPPLENLSETLLVGRYTFLPQKQELWLDQKLHAKLSHRENELLLLLVQHRHQVLERKAALLQLWGDDSFFQARTMDVFITKLRKHLREDPSVEILNIRGVGYKLIS